MSRARAAASAWNVREEQPKGKKRKKRPTYDAHSEDNASDSEKEEDDVTDNDDVVYNEQDKKDKSNWMTFVPEVKELLHCLLKLVVPGGCLVGIFDRVKNVTHFTPDGTLLGAQQMSALNKGVVVKDLSDYCAVSPFFYGFSSR